MEYYSALKRGKSLTYATIQMNLEIIMLSERSQILCDSTYMTSLEESDSQSQKAEWWLPEVEGREEWGIII